MGAYDSRTEPVYGPPKNLAFVHDHPSTIPDWWEQIHDNLIARQIIEEQWVWYWGISEKIEKITPKDVLDNWRMNASLANPSRFATRLMEIAEERAEYIGLRNSIRKAEWRICPICHNAFIEDSLPYPIIRRLGINQLDFCSPCFCEAVFLNNPNNGLSKSKIIVYLNDLTNVIGRVPTQDYGTGMNDFLELTTEERQKVFEVLKGRPTLRRVRKVFGSWLNALIQAGILKDGVRKTSRGTQCIAKDGHVCLSIGEKTIDDYLYGHNISHEKEVNYPECGFRADFSISGSFIEYFGLCGDPSYDKKIAAKIATCQKFGILLIQVFPEDLASSRKLEKKLAPFIPLLDE